MMNLTPVPTVILDLSAIIELAHRVAKDAHHNQTCSLMKKTTSTKLQAPPPYIVHPEAVADLLEPRWKPLGYLHDVMDENPEDYPEAKMRDLFPAWIVDRLVLLRRIDGQNYDDYVVLNSDDEGTRKTKIADLRDNLKDLSKGSLRDKYRLALRLLGETP